MVDQSACQPDIGVVGFGIEPEADREVERKDGRAAPDVLRLPNEEVRAR